MSTYTYKKINDQLAKNLNRTKVSLAMAQDDKLALEREMMDVKEENALLRSREGQVDQQTLESEIQRRLIDYMGPIKGNHPL